MKQRYTSIVKGGPPARDAHADVSQETSAGRGIITSLRAHPFVSAFVALLTVLAALAWSLTREPTYEEGPSSMLLGFGLFALFLVLFAGVVGVGIVYLALD